MSLKAKIEAVIYASEEPVTLAQLTGLLGQEAQAELDHLDSAQQSLALDGDSAPELELSEATEAPPLPEADIEGETASAPAEEVPAPDNADQTEPEPTDPVPSKEPEPTDESPIPEHSVPETVAESDIAAQPEPAKSARDTRQDEKLRERRLREYFRSILDELIADYATSARGLEIREVASGYRLGTKPEYHDAVRGFVKSLKPPLKLSLQALETLAVVAYKQPVTAPEISEIRGVDSGGVLGSLMARKLITTAGRKQVIGRPILYKTTRDFLLRFGLKDVSELPSIEEFEKMAGELADVEPVQEEIPMSSESQSSENQSPESQPHNVPESPDDLEAEASEVEPQSDGTSIPLAGSDESSAGVPSATEYDVLPDQAPNEETPFESPALDAELEKEQAEEETVKSEHSN